MEGLTQWFSQRPKWQQDAVRRLFEQDGITSEDISELTNICLKETAGGSILIDYSVNFDDFVIGDTSTLRLSSIGQVEGINKLKPKSPLFFGETNLSIIYGLNGSGKSGYVRILKHACNARHKGEILPDVFDTSNPNQGCRIEYFKDGSTADCDWTVESGIVDDLQRVDIYDSLCGSIYVSKDSEITYEPLLLSFFSELIEVCNRVAAELEELSSKHVSKKPLLPADLNSTELGVWYENLGRETHQNEVDERCSWTDDNKKEMLEIRARLSEGNPGERARKLRIQKEHLDSVVNDLKLCLDQLADKNCQPILEQKELSQIKSKAAETAATEAFGSSPLPDVGSEIWKELWEKARVYSQVHAYKGEVFPFTGTESRCVLCQQILDSDAKGRVGNFESFVTGELQQEANQQEQEFKTIIEKLPEVPQEESLRTRIDASGLSIEEHLDRLVNIFKTFASRKEDLTKVKVVSDLVSLPKIDGFLTNLEGVSRSYEEQAEKFELDAEKDNRQELEAQLKNLQAKEWISQQRKAVEEEIERHMYVLLIETAKSSTATTGLSRKKGELADELITDAYVSRFNSELEKMGAKRVKVELSKKGVEHGRVLHCITMTGSKECAPKDVLSDGEFRIVSLAAFFADVASKEHASPFVFDDPISSLDQDYEEAVVHRLIELSKERQVIIFTHRLSLLGLVQEFAKKQGLETDVNFIKQEPWGAGEPGDIPLWAAKPKNAVNILLDQRLPAAKALLEEHGQEAYEIQAQALCSEFRKLLEKIVENDLLADVVQRHRRDIQTKGKIDKLAKITSEDCSFIESLMSKYSRYEHSQSGESPVSLPAPDEFHADIMSLKDWRNEFDNRDVS